MIENTHISEISKQIKAIEPVCKQLLALKETHHKLEALNSLPVVHQFLELHPALNDLTQQMDLKGQFLIKAILAIGQGSIVFQKTRQSQKSQQELVRFITLMQEIETFYDVIGGVIGYHLTVLKLIEANEVNRRTCEAQSAINYYEPEGIDLTKDLTETNLAVRWGIENMGQLGEIYPLGGAGDRLGLIHETYGHLLPAAQLMFSGRTLLEGMIRDLQGREFLFYKLFDRQLITPIAMMTSHEKNNHESMIELCQKSRWFDRPKDCFSFFYQLCVPMVTREGNWAMQRPLHPILKPGGHGVIWKEAHDQKIFEWFKNHGKGKALVRQINNPVAGLDKGLLALSGIGCHKKKKFGFASCSRLVNMPEGMNVLRERVVDKEYEYCITNIEYTDFEKFGIEDVPKDPESPFSKFPANTNILFVDLETIHQLVEHCPLPGVVINIKSKVQCLTAKGKQVELYAGRLESTMQNIADYIVDRFSKPRIKDRCDPLSTFLTYNERRKTISVTKQSLGRSREMAGTPEGGHADMMLNYHELLENNCHFKLPTSHEKEEYLNLGPSILVNFHPALGLLYDVIAQKIQRGRIALGSEWVMEIAEAEVVNLDLDGCLLVQADSVMGKNSDDGVLVYDSAECGKCTLIDVTVKNKGVLASADNIFWKHQVTREETLSITLRGNGEFYAKGVVFSGNYSFEVLDGHRMVVEQKDHEVLCYTTKIDSPTWMWQYAFADDNKVILKKQERNSIS